MSLNDFGFQPITPFPNPCLTQNVAYQKIEARPFLEGDTIPQPLADWRSQTQQPIQLNLSFIPF
jgi:hypothetical protein